VNAVSQYLKQAGWTILTAEMSYVAKNAVEVTAAQRAEIEAFLSGLDEHDDVHRLYTALQ
jgi:transcriptional/translational regulatory protein YebC/TACO1